MGLEPYLVGDSLVGVIAQRLVRRLCPECKKIAYMTEDEKRLLGVTRPGQVQVYEPVGCDNCNNTGYKGRIGVYEIMPVTNALRIKIAAGSRADQIKEVAVSEGMHPLSESATRLFLEGTTSFKEALRITYESE